jgi:hypothetical protein
MRWSGTNPTSPAPRPIRTPAPAANRQSTTASALGSRGAQFRAAELQRGTPTQRGAKDGDPDKDDDDDREPLLGRDEDKDDDGADDGKPSDNGDTDDDKEDDQKTKVKS